MTHGSFFSGKGGFDLAAEWAGWNNVFNCEIDPFCRWQLKYWNPNAKQHTDVNRTEEFEQYEGRVNVLTAGFPCQPFSTAGERQGTDDPRYMWPQTFRGIRAIRPAVFVGENVSGLISWSKGMVFRQVCSDLESEGFTVIPLLLPACGVGALVDEVIPETIGQYVGHKDKEGHDIYEGDVITIDTGIPNYYKYICEVKWMHSGFESASKDNDWYPILTSQYDIEVVGTIHDNPELLTDLNP